MAGCRAAASPVGLGKNKSAGEPTPGRKRSRCFSTRMPSSATVPSNAAETAAFSAGIRYVAANACRSRSGWRATRSAGHDARRAAIACPDRRRKYSSIMPSRFSLSMRQGNERLLPARSGNRENVDSNSAKLRTTSSFSSGRSTRSQNVRTSPARRFAGKLPFIVARSLPFPFFQRKRTGCSWSGVRSCAASSRCAVLSARPGRRNRIGVPRDACRWLLRPGPHARAEDDRRKKHRVKR